MEATNPLNSLLLLLNLQQEARQAQTPEALRFLLVNQTRRMIAYQQAVFLTVAPSGKARLEAVSNVAVPERDAPFTRWLEAAASAIAAGAEARNLHGIAPTEVPPALARDWGQWGPAQALWVPLPGLDGTVTAVLWLARDDAWTDGEKVLLGQLSGGYGHAWWALTHAGRRSGVRTRKGIWALAVVAVLAAVLAIPVPQSTLAPAGGAPRDPPIRQRPPEGVVQRLHGQPYKPGSPGQPSFGFETSGLKRRLGACGKGLALA
ncbi:hypothetical protein GAY28_33680, partial [Azospirillum brasilense]|nr:hypothetical protein [Azospirillum brasilense]